MNKEKFLKNKKSGFSLVETIIAIAIISISLIGPMTVAQRALLSASYSRDQMKAYYLAEEGLEYIHYIRDKNTLEGNSWLSGLNNCFSTESSGNACGIDPFNSNINQRIVNCNNVATNSGVCRIYFNSGTGIYSLYSSGGLTIFRRWVKIYDTIGGLPLDTAERRVVSSVAWQTGPLSSKTISVTGFINNWKEQPTY